MSEPTIIVNGVTLSDGEVASLLIACNHTYALMRGGGAEALIGRGAAEAHEQNLSKIVFIASHGSRG